MYNERHRVSEQMRDDSVAAQQRRMMQMLEEIEPDPVAEIEDDEKTELLDGTKEVMFEVANALKDQNGRNYEENDGDADHAAVYTGEDIPIGKSSKKKSIKKQRLAK